MSARVYFMKTVNVCKDLSIICLRKMNSEDGQGYSVCILQFSCFTQYNRMQSKHKQTKCEHSRREDGNFLGGGKQLLARYCRRKLKMLPPPLENPYTPLSP